MKKEDKNGFFLSETMVVIAVVSVVLLGVFKIFSHVYTNYKQEERYNTINAINALSNIKKYFDNQGVSYDSITLNNGYADITNIQEYETDYFDAIKKEYSVDKLYLIDMSVEDKTFPNFNVILRKYINTIKTSGLILLVQVNGSEYANIKVIDDNIRLVGDAENEYITYVKLGGTFNEPGYISESGVVPTITWEPSFNSNEEGTYYMYYDFNGKILKRKVVVLELDKSFDYTSDEQIYISKLDGYYKLEVWGAQGGNIGNYVGGYGGYSIGYIYLSGNQQLYIAIGGAGSQSDTGGYNGGGSLVSGQSSFGASGGGATHIATQSGVLSSLQDAIDSILIVSGGGGGANNRSSNYGEGNGGYGGGYVGGTGQSLNHSNSYGYGYGRGGTQSEGGSSYWQGNSANPLLPGMFGTASLPDATTNFVQSGAGGGYYGGGGSTHGGAGGGSGYIGNSLLSNKAMYCYNCTTSSAEATKTVSTTCHSANATENCAKEGNGYAKITYIG